MQWFSGSGSAKFTRVEGVEHFISGFSNATLQATNSMKVNGDFKIGENLYTINDADGSVTFITGINGLNEGGDIN